MCDFVPYNVRIMDPMPQTVPSAGFSPTASSPPCDFSHFTADCFDLSLLPSPDGEVPYSPVSLQQVMSFYSDPTSSPPSMFPPAPSDVEGTKPPPQAAAGPGGDAAAGGLYAPVPAGIVKEEPQYTSFMPSPTPPSPSSERGGLDLQDILQESRFLQETVAKREQRRFSCAAERSKFPAAAPQSALPPAYTLPPPEEGPVAGPAGASAAAAAADHRLLREVLRDTSFQRKYNLKPFDFAGLAPGYVSAPAPPPPAIASPGGHSPAPSQPPPPPEVKLEEGEALQLSRERMEPVLSLAIEQLRKDVGDACSLLGIPPDPCRWTAGDVRAWLLWTLRQYALPMVPLEYFAMDGAALVQLSEHDFTHRAPQCGSTLYAQLEIWKAACQDLDIPWTNSSTSSSSPRGDPSDGEDEEEDEESRDMNSEAGSPAGPATGSGSGGGAARGATGARPGTAGGSGSGGGSGGGAHIHLWQFLKELLAAPQLHGSCIRWLDRPKGVFKIEDSVRVARLWGKRKNRPAMNYDKLSRSIRQYYKKGIMKKTERSQRLVYQFCHPYSL